MTFRKQITLGAAGLLLVTALVGCAGFGDLQQAFRRNTSDDIGQTRANRKDKLAQDFDRQRDDAQFDAAASSWERGDVEGARKILDQLLDRSPNHRRARLLLADLYLFNGDAERSMAELNKALAADPKDAMAHHSLAQIFDACGRRDEALAHYKTATQLEPSNQIYAQSYKMALDLAPTAPPREMLATTNPKADDRITPNVVSIPTSPVVAAPLVRPADDNANRPQSNRLFAAGNVDEWVKPIDLAAGGVSSGSPQNPPQIFNPPPSTVGANSAIVATGRQPNPSQVQLASWNSPDGNSMQPVEPTVKLAAPPAQSLDPAAPPANPQIRQSPLREAVVALAQGDIQTAIAAAQRGLTETPGQSAALHRVLGAAQYRRGDYQAAQTELAQALSLDKTDALSYFLMSATLEKLDSHEAAARYRAEAARLDGRYAQ